MIWTVNQRIREELASHVHEDTPLTETKLYFQFQLENPNIRHRVQEQWASTIVHIISLLFKDQDVTVLQKQLTDCQTSLDESTSTEEDSLKSNNSSPRNDSNISSGSELIHRQPHTMLPSFSRRPLTRRLPAVRPDGSRQRSRSVLRCICSSTQIESSNEWCVFSLCVFVSRVIITASMTRQCLSAVPVNVHKFRPGRVVM